jgi:hypothetical protein
MAAKQLIRPEIIFVFIRVHSWLKTFRPSRRRATKSVGVSFFSKNVDFQVPGKRVTAPEMVRMSFDSPSRKVRFSAVAG